LFSTDITYCSHVFHLSTAIGSDKLEINIFKVLDLWKLFYKQPIDNLSKTDFTDRQPIYNRYHRWATDNQPIN
jgi:predicted peroxiredoxin